MCLPPSLSPVVTHPPDSPRGFLADERPWCSSGVLCRHRTLPGIPHLPGGGMSGSDVRTDKDCSHGGPFPLMNRKNSIGHGYTFTESPTTDESVPGVTPNGDCPSTRSRNVQSRDFLLGGDPLTVNEPSSTPTRTETSRGRRPPENGGR